MEKLYSVKIKAETTKEISVYCGDATAFDQSIDILTTSAFIGSYAPTPRTIFKALHDRGISAYELSKKPEIDLRTPCHIWLSQKISSDETNIGRIGCMEFLGYRFTNPFQMENDMIHSIRSYFFMLDIALVYGVKMDTIALPLLGSGSQNIAPEFILVPLMNECISFLKRNAGVKKFVLLKKMKRKQI